MTNRKTRQRDVITQVFMQSHRPLTVGAVLELSQKQLPTLGIATVYRTIKLLCENNTIHPITLDGETLYEACGRGHHHHFCCNVCGTVYTLHSCPVQLPKGSVYGEGFLVDSHELTLYGICPPCQEKQRQEKQHQEKQQESSER